MKFDKNLKYYLIVFSIISIIVFFDMPLLEFTGKFTTLSCDYHPADLNRDWKINLTEAQFFESCRINPYHSNLCRNYSYKERDSRYIVSSFYLMSGQGGEYYCNETGSYPTRWIREIPNNQNFSYEYIFTGERKNISWTYNFDYNNNCLIINPVNKYAMFLTNETINITTTANQFIRVYNYDSKEIKNGTFNVILSNLSVGHYFIESSCGDRAQFMVLPKDYEGASFIGDDQIAHHKSYSFERAKIIKPKIIRILSSSNYWSTVKPLDKEPFNFTLLNQTVNNAFSIGAERVIINLWRRPSWMIGSTNDNRFLEKYLEYVNETAKFLNSTPNRNKIAFAIWNEPHYEGTVGMGQDLPFVVNAKTENISNSYFRLLNASYHIIKKINPNYEVVGTAITRPFFDHNSSYFMNTLRGVNILDSLGNTYKRKIAYDDINENRVFDDRGLGGDLFFYNESRFDDLILRWKTKINGKEIYSYENALFGNSPLEIPFTYLSNNFLSEFGPTNISYQRGSNRAMKQIIMGRAANLSVIINHVLNSFSQNISSNYEMYGFEYASQNGQRYGRGPHPKTTHWLLTAYWLNNATFIEKRILNNEVFFYGFRRNNGENIVFVWAKEGTTKQLKDNTLDARDIYGKKVKVSRLGEEPVIFYSNTKNISEIMNDVQNNLV
ncbi:MAG: hypothetical protein QXG18_01445 [Candidatus Pacearchaeota archaeon]